MKPYAQRSKRPFRKPRKGTIVNNRFFKCGPLTICHLKHRNGTESWGWTRVSPGEPFDFRDLDVETRKKAKGLVPDPFEISRGRAEVALQSKLRGKKVRNIFAY